MHASNTLAHIERTKPSPSFFANKSLLTIVHGHPPLHQLSPLLHLPMPHNYQLSSASCAAAMARASDSDRVRLSRMPTKPCIKMYTARLSASMFGRFQGVLTDRSQEHKPNGVQSHCLIRANLSLVEPEEGIPVGDEMAKGCPSQVDSRIDHETEQMKSNRLHHQSVLILVTEVKAEHTYGRRMLLSQRISITLMMGAITNRARMTKARSDPSSKMSLTAEG